MVKILNCMCKCRTKLLLYVYKITCVNIEENNSVYKTMTRELFKTKYALSIKYCSLMYILNLILYILDKLSLNVMYVYIK